MFLSISSTALLFPPFNTLIKPPICILFVKKNLLWTLDLKLPMRLGHLVGFLSKVSKSAGVKYRDSSSFISAPAVVKGCVCYILQVKRALVKLGKKFFNSLQRIFSFSGKSKFRILDIQISWHFLQKPQPEN